MYRHDSRNSKDVDSNNNGARKNDSNGTLLQGLTWFSATQTGCRWLISYIEQTKFLACEPEISVDFSAPPEFSGGVMEKCLNTG